MPQLQLGGERGRGGRPGRSSPPGHTSRHPQTGTHYSGCVYEGEIESVCVREREREKQETRYLLSS